jgi:hypothetical protein
MDKELIILSAQPNDLYFNWQLRVQLNNLRKHGLSHKYVALIWEHDKRQRGEDFKKQWKELENDYPEAKFFFIKDTTGELHHLISSVGYIPLLRPWLLSKFFEITPHIDKTAILYIDSDVVFTQRPDFSHLINDDICYLSDTKSYIAASYFDSKIKDVLPEKLESYKEIDVLGDSLGLFDLQREIAEKNENNSGGAQYLLKNIDASFWKDVFRGCVMLKTYLNSINRRFFENEDKGFQSWCADMWSVLFNLWKRGYETRCPKEMDFCWATDPIEKWDQVQIYHDAGATTRPVEEGHQLFHKREHKYINNFSTPFDDDLSFVSSKYCSFKYVKEIEESAKAQSLIDN